MKRMDLASDRSNGIIGKCYNLFLDIASEILNNISINIDNGDKESLASLLDFRDYQLILSLYYYPSGSFIESHEDRGLLTFVYCPSDKNLRDSR